ncbi:helix-turn-helix transcriptional regulator [Pelagicoccus enzymogenes]|uniref:helix-turn-helix transcriptional regulator n=1 Tax=Pelagicoccus enzymogenes TaxID=2773457 RepID=UPI00280E7BFB|nr:helix-turn-helix transcriptional regulator [Pelagicoccus enzymogenes]MDQ8197459.1 helix-turn-helix transcriptional regulator [Pelagicoccus enzymogenes]
MSENEIAEQILQEFRSSETLALDIRRLTSLFALLGQLGWSIASQDSRYRNRYHLHGQARPQFDTAHVTRKQLLAHLTSQPEKLYLHESSQLVIWRNQESDTLQKAEIPLTKRESEIHALLLDGLTLPKIAQELGISKRTAEKHVQNLYKKKGVHTYNELLFQQ